MNELLYSVLNSTAHNVCAIAAAQNTVPPYAVYTLVSDNAEMCAGGMTDLKEVRYQLDVYSFSYLECKSIMTDLLTAIRTGTTFKHIIYDLTDGIEPDGKTYRSRLEFKLWSI